jgi:hypothetical protein
MVFEHLYVSGASSIGKLGNHTLCINDMNYFFPIFFHVTQCREAEDFGEGDYSAKHQRH